MADAPRRSCGVLGRRQFLAGSGAALATSALPAPSLAQPARILRFVPHAALTFVDPVANLTAVTNIHAFYVFETLYAVDASMRPQPQMAVGHSVSDDGRTWTIGLREGLVFHDGTPVQARDCAASLRRWAARDVFGRDLATAVEAWEAPDDRTLRIRLKRPFPLLIDAIGKPTAALPAIMPERIAMLDPMKPVAEAIGSGPLRFKADEFVSGSRVVYERFDRYVPRPEPPDNFAGGKVVHFDRVEWTVMPDPATAVSALQAGEVDWVDQVQPDLVPVLAKRPIIATDSLDPAGFLGVIRFNCLHPPFDNPAIRRLVLRAVRQSDYMDVVTGGDPKAWVRSYSMFPTTTPYGQPPADHGMSDEPDIAAAQRALKAAGYRGERVVILNPSDLPIIAPLGPLTADLLKRIGFNVDLQDMDWGTVIYRNTSKEPIERGGWSLYHTWWGGAGIGQPVSNGLIRGQGDKGLSGWYTSAPMEALNAEWLAASDEASRKAIAGQMNALAMQDAPSVPLGVFFVKTAYRRDLTGMLKALRPVPWNVRRA